jgi:hypothetical protein
MLADRLGDELASSCGIKPPQEVDEPLELRCRRGCGVLGRTPCLDSYAAPYASHFPIAGFPRENQRFLQSPIAHFPDSHEVARFREDWRILAVLRGLPQLMPSRRESMGLRAAPGLVADDSFDAW